MNAHTELLLPPPALASCISLGIYRDTVGVGLSDRNRLNYFPASPFYAVSRVFDGQLHMARGLTDVATLRATAPIPHVTATPPIDGPVCSWSPSGMRAMTIAFYPDAWTALGGCPKGGALPPSLEQALMADMSDLRLYWAQVCKSLTILWDDARAAQGSWPSWTGSHRVADWVRHTATATTLSGTGQSLRSMERRLRRLTGHSKQSLDFFAKVEDLHELSLNTSDMSLAQIAAEAEFSDQSHMGRTVKRATGFSPGQINKLIATQEPFWCYRLLGERF